MEFKGIPSAREIACMVGGEKLGQLYDISKENEMKAEQETNMQIESIKKDFYDKFNRINEVYKK